MVVQTMRRPLLILIPSAPGRDSDIHEPQEQSDRSFEGGQKDDGRQSYAEFARNADNHFLNRRAGERRVQHDNPYETGRCEDSIDQRPSRHPAKKAESEDEENETARGRKNMENRFAIHSRESIPYPSACKYRGLGNESYRRRSRSSRGI